MKMPVLFFIIYNISLMCVCVCVCVCMCVGIYEPWLSTVSVSMLVSVLSVCDVFAFFFLLFVVYFIVKARGC